MILNEINDSFNPIFEVVSCIIEYNGKILLLKRQIHKPQANKYSLPAGKVEKNENLKNAIVRETLEETGIDLSNQTVIFIKTRNVEYDEYQFKYHSFYCKLETEPDVIINKKEHQTFIWQTPQESLKCDLIEDEDECIIEFYKL